MNSHYAAMAHQCLAQCQALTIPEMTLWASAILFSLYIVLIILGHIWNLIWMHVDDGDVYPSNTFASKAMMHCFGYKYESQSYSNNSIYVKYDKDGRETERVVSGDLEGFYIVSGLLLIVLPWFILATVALYQVAIALAVGFGVLRVARAVRRQQKILKAHMADKNAHR